MGQVQLSAEMLLQRALDFELLTERQVQELRSAFGFRVDDAEEVKKQFLRAGYMTNYQIDRLSKGEKSGFFFGPYKALYVVGAGTFARVFPPSIVRPAKLSP